MAEGHGGCGVSEFVVFVLALIFGTACSLTSKVLMSMESKGLTGETELFTNPLFQTCTMFIGMLASLPVHYAVLKFKIPFYGYAHYDETRGKYIAINGEDTDKPKEISWSIYMWLLVPALFDLVATALCMFGLRYVDVSIYQMLRGGSIVFVALLKQFYLLDKLKKFMWVGVWWNFVAICLVGYVANLNSTLAKSSEDIDPLKDNSDMNHPLIGVALILTGAVVQSLQYAWEEKVMSLDIGAPPLLLIGMEGFWGTLFCIFVLYPLAYYLPGSDHGSIENPFNTIELMRNSVEIQNVFWLYFISIFGYNMLCALITFLLNSVWHAILDNFRPITVWGSDLFIYYCVTTALGEQWTQFSYIQVCALCVLLYGTAIYNAPNPGSIKLTGGILSFFMDFTPEYASVIAEENQLLTANANTKNAIMQSPHFHHMSPFRTQGASPAYRKNRERSNSLMREQRGYGTDLEMAKAERKMSFA